MNLNYLAQHINQLDPQPTVYIGVDSYLDPRLNQAVYTTAVVLHSTSASEVYGTTQTHQVYEQAKHPHLRLIREAQILVETFQTLKPLVRSKIELHLDYNPDPRYKSNKALKEMCGYVEALTGVIPRVKPDSWAASTVADRLQEILNRSPHKKFT